jgi:hypothetical protein
MDAGKLEAGDKWRLLNCRRLPGRLSVEETAVLLGVKEHDIAILIAAGCLRPLGRPAANAPKKFAAVTIETLREDAQWLSKATAMLAKAWFAKNARAKIRDSTIKGANGRFASPTDS